MSAETINSESSASVGGWLLCHYLLSCDRTRLDLVMASGFALLHDPGSCCTVDLVCNDVQTGLEKSQHQLGVTPTCSMCFMDEAHPLEPIFTHFLRLPQPPRHFTGLTLPSSHVPAAQSANSSRIPKIPETWGNGFMFMVVTGAAVAPRRCHWGHNATGHHTNQAKRTVVTLGNAAAHPTTSSFPGPNQP